MKSSLNFLSLAFLLLALSGCFKDEPITTDRGAKLEFSVDTLFFDTIFTQLSSVTLNFRAYNRNSEAIRIDEIRLEGGSTSFYRINANGIPGPVVTDQLLGSGDSLYIFVEVTIDPTNQDNPLAVEDSISFSVNGNYQTVDLLAFGQDAVIYFPTVFPDNGLPPYSIVSDPTIGPVTWNSNKPILIFGYAVVDEGGALTIQEGTKVHFHAFSGLWIFEDAQFTVEGSASNPVVFQGDRLEEIYDDEPGQWDRIWINRSIHDHHINHAIIKNALIGIQAEAAPFEVDGGYITNNTLQINNTTITHSSAAGIFARNYRIHAENLAMGNCGEYAFLVSGGGEYQFNNATISNYWTFAPRETPSFAIINEYSILDETYQRPITNSFLTNSIVDGGLTNEFLLELSGENDFSCSYTLLKTDQTLPNGFENIYLNQNPQLLDPFVSDFRPSENAFVLKKANPATATLLDITGMPRPAEPAIGAYEYQPE
jgi:hypothetical protein